MQNPFTKSEPRKATRFRGTLFLAQHGPDDAIRGLTVCTDFAGACIALAGAPDGDIWIVGPDEGAPLRAYLAGSPPPLACTMRAEPENIIAEVARVVGVSVDTARRAVEGALRDHGGIGATLYEARNMIQGGANLRRIDTPPDEAA